MFGEVIRLWENGEYSYPLACGFVPTLVSYIHEDEKIRPCMIIVPGGGYRFVSQREGAIVARTFYDKGYNTFVLTYTTDLTMTEPVSYTHLFLVYLWRFGCSFPDSKVKDNYRREVFRFRAHQ